MSMFCFQCQEAAKNTGCTVRGVCGKEDVTAGIQDLLIYTAKGVGLAAQGAGDDQVIRAGRYLVRSLFATITNANFDRLRIASLVLEGLALRGELLAGGLGHQNHPENPDILTWKPLLAESRSLEELQDQLAAALAYQAGRSGVDQKKQLENLPEEAQDIPALLEDLEGKAALVGILAQEQEDVRSLRELTIYGLKGIAAYAEHAAVLGYEDPEIYRFAAAALARTTQDENPESLTALVLETGKTAVTTMALLDKANTETYGNPEITQVNIGTRSNPAILISGHDLKDMEELLEQTAGTGVDVYTHSEMLPANYYPAFKKYDHFVGNYGNAWWQQDKEFESFNGVILMTTNCIVPPKESYKTRIFTTGMAGFPGVPHISEDSQGRKDFSALVSLAKTCRPPIELEQGSITGGFAHHQISQLADKVIDAVKSGALKRFVVMAGCDGRHKSRDHFTQVAQGLPRDTVILTAGCAKYRYNKLDLGDIGGIPRVLDAGQCNDSYSLAVTALTLKEAFGMADINDLPIDFDIAWYEQKAVAVLLALLHLGFKNVRLGPTLPAFLSPGVAKVLVDTFGIQGTGTVEEDLAAITAS